MVNRAAARERRYRKLCALIGLNPTHRVLDVGCGAGASFGVLNTENEIVGLDLSAESGIDRPNFHYIAGDGTEMPFGDGQFDAVVCVGVLEHLFPLERVTRMAREIRRVGKGYAIVVPDQWTLIEPHYRLPLWQFYPDGLKALLAALFPLGAYRRARWGQFRRLNYFSRSQWLSFFPGARAVVHNHVSFLVRNLILYHRVHG